MINDLIYKPIGKSVDNIAKLNALVLPILFKALTNANSIDAKLITIEYLKSIQKQYNPFIKEI